MIEEEMKYKTLSDLKKAIDSNELQLKEGEKLLLDNDSTYLYLDREDYVQVFDMHPQQLLEEALTELGIPWDYV